MYYYLYDSFLVDKKYKKLIADIETRTSELGISGKIIRLSLLKNVKEVVEDISKEENPTIVIIGRDETFSEAVSANWESKNTLFGFIPAGGYSELSFILDLPKGADGCDVVSQRRVLQMDLGRVNNSLFFTYLEFSAKDVLLSSPLGWQIIPKHCSKIRVINLGFRQNPVPGSTEFLVSQPQDEYLEIVTLKRKTKYFIPLKTETIDSLFFVKQIQIKSTKKENNLFIEESKQTIKSPFNIKISSRKVKIIVGRERMI